MRVRYSIGLCIAMFVLFTYPIKATANSLVDDGWVPPNFPKQGQVNVTFADNAGVLMGAGAPHLEWRNGKNGADFLQLLCRDLGDPRCSATNGKFIYFTRLVSCNETNRLDCIESVSALRNGVTYQGVQKETFPKSIRTSYVNDPSKNLPLASSGAIWSFPGVQHVGGEDFFLNAILTGSKSAKDAKFLNDGISINISAIELRKTSKDDGSSYVLENTRASDGTFLGAVGIYPPYEDEQYLCVMSGDGLCANRRALPSELEFKLVLRLSSSPSGWLHGRLGDGNLSITPLEEKNAIRVSIQGSTVRVPSLGFAYSWRELPKEIQSKYTSGEFTNQSRFPTIGCRWCSDDPLINTLVSNPFAYGPDAFQELDAWKEIRKDSADADLNTWSVRSLSEYEMEGAASCFAKKGQINGFVTTNATVYSAGPPKIVSGSLDYQVAAPHLRSDGSELLGRYRLIVRSDVARCVYGFSQAPVSARVTVTSSNGTSQVATTSVSERNGWLTLSADNFTFSNPVIRVVLQQQKDGDGGTVISRKTIVCTKGKLIKKISAVNPKCPIGYKKK